MGELKEEVNDTISEFMQTATEMRENNQHRQDQLDKIKKEYRKLQR